MSAEPKLPPSGIPTRAGSQSCDTLSRTILPGKERKFSCTEPRCGAKYVRKGDLARHKREQHSFETYLCPFRSCDRHREGYGFKRMHRLVSHLSNTTYRHPQALSRLDAKYIAVDYNDSISNLAQLPYEFRFQGATTPDKVVLDAVVENHLGELSRYLDRLCDDNLWPTWLPSIGCPMADCDSEIGELYLVDHMEANHSVDHGQAHDLCRTLSAEKERNIKESIGRKRQQLALDNA